MDSLHLHGKLVQVWVDAEVTTESVSIYAKLINLGVDSFCTDYPLKVIRVRDLYTKIKEEHHLDVDLAPAFAKRLRVLSMDSELGLVES